MLSEQDFLRIFGKLNDMPTAITLADMSQPDAPLIYANPAFSKLTGYDLDDVIGRNCRFLQGDGTNENAVLRLRNAIKSRHQTFNCLLNYRKDGEAFHNMLMLAPIDQHEHRNFIIGCQYEFRMTPKDIEIKLHLDNLNGMASALEPDLGKRWQLFRHGTSARTQSIRLIVDRYVGMEKLNQLDTLLDRDIRQRSFT